MSNELIPHIAQGELVQIQEATERIQANLKEMDKNNRRNLSLAVETGVELLQVKQQLKHGEFGNWLQDNFSMSRTEATRYMQLGRYFADKMSNLDNLPPLSVAYLLVQTTTPDAVRQAVLSGEIPQTIEAVKEAIAIEKTGEKMSDVSDNDEEGDWDDFIKETTPKMKARGKAVAQEAIEIGKMLLETVLESDGSFNVGHLNEWAAAEFGMDAQDVAEFVKYGNRYKDTPIDELPEATIWEIVGTYSSWYFDRYKDRPGTSPTPPLYAERKLLASVADMPEFHEMTRVIPAMKPREYADLVQSIKQNGLSLPIKTFRGKIIDGRMRYLACRDAGVLPRFEELTIQDLAKEGTDVSDGDILRYICSVNFIRTSLTEDQQAMIAVMADKFEHDHPDQK